MHPAIEAFLADPDLVRFDPEGGMSKVHTLIYHDAITNRAARGFERVVIFIVQRDRSLKKKMDDLCKLIAFSKSHPGCVTMFPSTSALEQFLDSPAALAERFQMKPNGELGTVKFYNPTAEFGFIASDSGTDIYFHATSIESHRVPSAGDRVKFIPGLSRRGRALARNVAVLQTLTR